MMLAMDAVVAWVETSWFIVVGTGIQQQVSLAQIANSIEIANIAS
jgi:hypothetical protein